MEIEEEEGDHGLHKNGLKMKTTVTRIYKKKKCPALFAYFLKVEKMQANKHKHKKVNKEIQIVSLNTEAEKINKHIINTDSTRNQSSNILMAITKDIFISVG